VQLGEPLDEWAHEQGGRAYADCRVLSFAPTEIGNPGLGPRLAARGVSGVRLLTPRRSVGAGTRVKAAAV